MAVCPSRRSRGHDRYCAGWRYLPAQCSWISRPPGLVAHVATLSRGCHIPPTVGRSCSVGNQARGGAAGRANANMAYRQVRRLSGRRAGLRAADAPAPRLPKPRSPPRA